MLQLRQINIPMAEKKDESVQDFLLMHFSAFRFGKSSRFKSFKENC